MERFNYQFVLIGVVVGLAVTEILGCVANILSARHRTRVYWVHLLWLAIAFMLAIQYWYAAFGWRSGHTLGDSFVRYMMTLSVPIAIYLSASMISPKTPPDGEVFDFRKYYYENHRGIFSMFALTIAVYAVHRTLASGGAWLRPTNLVRGAALLCLVSLAVWDNRKFHVTMVFVMLATFFGFTFGF